MLTNCNICNSENIKKIYQFADRAITSICSEKNQPSPIYYCHACTHVLTEPLKDIKHFYADAYNINADSEEEDQLLKILDGKKIYRCAYQADTLIKKLELNKDKIYKILDFGAAKASTLRKICEVFPHVSPSVFDVSEKYKHFWDKFIPDENQFMHSMPEKTQGYFDVVCSFFMLEHVFEPVEILTQQYALLKEEGTVYFVIPNLYKNTADLLVLDHINHFSVQSLKYMMEHIGFSDVNIDEDINDGWFVVSATKKTAFGAEKPQWPSKEVSEKLFLQAKHIADYWHHAYQQVRDFDTKEPFAVYGAGFYGSYIALNLRENLKPVCFIDQNSYLQGKKIHNIEVFSPEKLPSNVKHIVVGINPLVAKAAIQSVDAWSDKNFTFHYIFSQ